LARYVGWSWTTGGIIRQLPEIASGGWFDYGPRDVSTNGRVIVGWANVVSGRRAIRWTDGVSQDLGAGSIYGTNSDGTISVGSSDDAARVATVWDNSGQVRSIQALLGTTPDLTGWSLTLALAVSDDGKVATGYGQHDGRLEGWVAHLP
jgi:probable HAF family extracellular repeat protein